MAELLQISGIDKVVSKLQKLKNQQRKKSPSVITGYTAAYALFVHEMRVVNRGKKRKGKHPSGQKRRGNYWDPSGSNNKFLERAVRENKGKLKQIITTKLGRGATLEQALYIAALLIQRVSQQIVPVDTGNLKASAFTAIE